MNYQETIEYLFAQLPMYQRQGKSAFKKDLKNSFALSEALGKPELNFPSIHIAGTNGKGSTAHILSAIYQNNGYKVGLYTSPHLLDFRERIKINGEMISEKAVVDFVQEIQSKIDHIQPSFFELTVAMAFDHFSKEQVDIAIIETGLGGRLDSTNIIVPELSIITSIGFDHMDMLGDTLEKIAFEKAGIIKAHIPVVVGLLPAEAEETIKEVSHERQALYYDAIRTPHRFTAEGLVETDLKAAYQQLNIKLALCAVDALQHKFKTTDERILEALKQVCALSGLRGRWERLEKDPRFLFDVAHNEEGLRINLQRLKDFEKSSSFVLGFVHGKPLLDLAYLFPTEGRYYLVKPEVQRGLDANEACQIFVEAGFEAQACSSLKEALKLAMEDLNDHRSEMVYIGGSNFIIADLLLLEKENQLPL